LLDSKIESVHHFSRFDTAVEKLDEMWTGRPVWD